MMDGSSEAMSPEGGAWSTEEDGMSWDKGDRLVLAAPGISHQKLADREGRMALNAAKSWCNEEVSFPMEEVMAVASTSLARCCWPWRTVVFPAMVQRARRCTACRTPGPRPRPRT